MAEQQPPAPRLELDPHLRRVALMIGYMVIIAGFAYALTVIWPIVSGVMRVLAPFIAALVVAYIFNPIVTFVQERLRLTRIGGVIAVNLLILIVLATFIGILVPILINQTRSAYEGIDHTARTRVLPFVYEQLGLDHEPEESSIRALENLVDDWVADQQPDIRSEEVREHLQELRVSVRDWTDGLESRDLQEVEDDDAEAELEHVTAEEDFEELRRRVLSWTTSHFRIAESTDDRQQSLDLFDQVNRWIFARQAYHRGHYAPPSWEEVRMRSVAWLEARGVDPERVLRDFAGSTQMRVAAAEGFGIVGAVFAAFVAAVFFLINSFIFLFFVFLVSFYLLIDFDKLKTVLRTMCPEKHEERFFDVLGKMDKAVGGFLRGQIIVALVVGTLTTVGLMMLGLKQYALLIGIVAGLGNLIPYLGPIIGATPAALYVLMTDSYESMQQRLLFLAITLGMFALIQTLESLILQPKVVGKHAQLHPVIVMMALILGAQFGILGMIIALPVTCIIRVLLKEFYWDRRAARFKEPQAAKA